MLKVSVREARERIGELLDSASAGEEIVITRRGKPTARLVALNAEETVVSFPDHRDFRARQPVAQRSSVDLIRELRDEQS